MNRTRAEVLQLLEYVQIAVIIGYLVDLGLPWWDQTDSIEKVGVITGWASLGAGSGNRGYGWFSMIGMIAIVVALIFRQWVMCYVAGAIAILTAAATTIDVTHAQSDEFGRTHPGTWIGVILLVICAVAALNLAGLLRPRKGGWSVRE